MWKNIVVVSGKSQADINIEKWLTYRVIIGYTVIDPGKGYSLKDLKDKYSSEDKSPRAHVERDMGCGLDGFEKKGEWRSINYQFCQGYSAKAWTFFINLKFKRDLIQPIKNYIGIVHEDYMKTLRLMYWKLFDLLDLEDQAFTDSF